MDITVISENTYNLRFENYGEFLSLFGNEPELCCNDGFQLSEHLRKILGIKSYKAAFIECFTSEKEVLVFLRINTGNTRFYAFDDFDSLTDAVSEYNDTAASALYFYDGKYILAVSPSDMLLKENIFSEFGEALNVPAEYELFLKEHGKIIISEGAISAIYKKFIAI